MSQGLRPHYHQCYEDKVETYFDKSRGCLVKKVTLKCMIPHCNFTRHEIYECYYPPPRQKDKNKVLQRNKSKHSNQ